MGTAITIVILIIVALNLLAFLSPKFRRENSLHERAKRLGWRPKYEVAATFGKEYLQKMNINHTNGYLKITLIDKDGKEMVYYEEDKG